MDRIVMTLLVRRVPEENARWPYAVQMGLPVKLASGETRTLTAVRLITTQGTRSSILAAMDFYRPEEWRAATPAEQAAYIIKFNGNPQPWHCVLRSLCASVYDYPGAGDRETNNGQVWMEPEKAGPEWKTERRLKQSCQEELEAEWDRSLRRAAHSAAVSGGESSFQATSERGAT